MEIYKHTTGKLKGRINISETLKMMEPGDTWMASSSIIDYNYLTTAVHNISRKLKRSYETSARAELKGKFTVTRIS